MSKILGVCISILLAVSLSNANETKTIPKGWSLNGVGINESSIDPTTFDSNIQTIWKYVDGSWQAYSSEDTMKTSLQKANIEELQSIDQGEGFWINATAQTSFTSTILNKFVPNSFETSEDSTYDGYTYNYTTEGGIIQSEKVNWSLAQALAETNTSDAEILEKTIAKVFYSSNKKTALVIQNIDCGNNDITIAVTPYSSINSIPGVNELLIQNAKSLVTPSVTTGTSTDTNINWSLTTYSGSNIEVVKEFSSDISIENSNGTKIPLSSLDTICSDLDGYVIFKSGTLDSGASYKFHYVNGYNDINSTDVTLTQTTNSVKLPFGMLKNLKPFYISKTSSTTLDTKSELAVSIKGSVLNSNDPTVSLFSSKVDTSAISFTESTTDTSSFPSINDLTTTYEIVYGLVPNATLKHYITPATLSGYYLFGYDILVSQWKQLSDNMTGNFSHFVVVKTKTTTTYNSCTGSTLIEGKQQDNITLNLGSSGYYNINVCGSVQVMTSDSSVATVTREVTQYVDEMIVTPVNTGTATITVSDDNGAAYIFLTVQNDSNTITLNGKTYGTVTSPYTSKVWLDRNLGADQVCTSYNDTTCYGDYYQWGRPTDGHEKTTSSTTTTLSSEIYDLNNQFILGTVFPYDWHNGWDSGASEDSGTSRKYHWSQDATGDGICPTGFRIPTIEELEQETINQGVNNISDAFSNFLKIPATGFRDGTTDGSMIQKDTAGYLWTNSVSTAYSEYIIYNTSWITSTTKERSIGMPVRCIKQ
jgi:uncharacterized protein (TIGR02145 family)